LSGYWTPIRILDHTSIHDLKYPTFPVQQAFYASILKCSVPIEHQEAYLTVFNLANSSDKSTSLRYICMNFGSAFLSSPH
jgi:hypothetical protein